MPRLHRFIAEIRRRRVVRVALTYGAAAFAAVQAADLYFPALGLPAWSFRLLAVVSLLGFPVTVALAWLFDLTPEGLRRTTPLARPAAAGAAPARESAAGMAGLAAAVTAVLLLFVGGAFAAFRGAGLLGGSTAPRFTVEQLTGEPGVEWFPSISPDGAWYVYSGIGPEGDRDIFLRSPGGQNVINLTADSPDDDDQPAFSPDGERIAFRTERGGGGLFVMRRTGENARRVTSRGYHPTWSPDGRKLAFVTEDIALMPQNADARSALWIVDVESGALRQLESVDDAVAPNWSPRGNRIAFFRRSLLDPETPELDDTGWGIWTVDTAGGAPSMVATRPGRAWNPVWSPDARHLYFASDRAGSMNLWRVRVEPESGTAAGEPEPLLTPAASLAHVSVSADGRHVLYSNVLLTMNVQQMPVDPVTMRPTGPAEWLTTGTRRWSSPDPSPDGKRVAMYSLTQPEGHIYVINADRTGQRQVTGDSIPDRTPRWSPDGNWLAYFTEPRGGTIQLWKIRPDGSEEQQLAASGSVPAWSPDGTRIAVAGMPTALVAATPTGQPVEALPPLGGGTWFAPNDWSPDGSMLAGGEGFGDSGVILYHFDTGRYERLTDFGQYSVWLPDNRTLLFVSGGTAFHTVDRVTREVQRVFEVRRDVIGPPRLSPDARTLYFTRRVTEADIWMLTFE